MYIYTYIYIHAYMICKYIYIYIYIYISADLFQSSSVLDYSCNPPMPSNADRHATAIHQYLPILTSIQASLTAGIPYSIILKGCH